MKVNGQVAKLIGAWIYSLNETSEYQHSPVGASGMNHRPAFKIFITRIAPVASLLLTILIYYRIEWGTLAVFVSAMDHCSLLFCDFVRHFYPMGKAILVNPLPVPGFFYSAFFAVALSTMGIFTLNTAVIIWAIFQMSIGVLLFIVSTGSSFTKRTSFAILGTIIFFMSFPLLHNFKWGQVSVLITLLILVSLFAYSRNCILTAALLLACATSIKYYPILFVLFFLLKRDWRFIMAFIIFLLVFLFIVPAVAIGPLDTVAFHRLSSDGVLKSDWIATDVGSQYIAHVFKRILSIPLDSVGFELFTSLIGTALVVCNFGLIYLVQRKGSILPPAFCFSLIFLSIPLIIRTSWPHYFVFLPFCQLTFIKILFRIHKQPGKTLLLSSAVSTSVVLSNIVFFNQWPHWSAYSHWGCLFFSNIALLIGFYGIFVTVFRAGTDRHTVGI